MEEAVVRYNIWVKSVDDAIDMKNKILANTIDKEKVTIKISVNDSGGF